ncbi:MAG: hypothetical protein GXP13_01020 [Gammaproteobacteria bacterium]|nr:hypothetical protein [Gammaproteobacteria bacterium]
MQRSEIKQLRFGCGASLQSAFVTRSRHWKKSVMTETKPGLSMYADKKNKNGVLKG